MTEPTRGAAAHIFVIRHGNTFEPDETPRRIGARTDLPLTACGVAQVEALGRWFAARDEQPARVLTGPLRRTRDTAALIADALSERPPIEIAPWLTEVDHGPDENRCEDEVVARIGADALAAWDVSATPPPGWIVDAPMRIAAWRAFLDGPLPTTTLLITSNGAARFALLASPSLAAGLPNLKLRTGAFGEVVRTAEGALHRDAWDIRP